ncbi:homeobox-leucine zipper protein HOX18 isoform X2 [Zea mays]|uniref:homeobox-leucine zipper protein HOX18 isoform X2 n=1 Tax=Zea mays TaxID=4577 RepID=UPI0009AA1F35|nr:homeobox-leucine zipper protein HOX18 isoform X2 [Zea mays]|eukprot:XP_020395236.1 homeobox-leucine zipper protein HOX18 isoform X2 [Zea mays]
MAASHRTAGPGPSDGSSAGARKKLQLTNEQSTLLEDTFRAHNILSNAQKQELARQVDLSARQETTTIELLQVRPTI